MASQQKTVIVTGASQGIGAGIAQSFLKRGCNLVANSRNSKSGPSSNPIIWLSWMATSVKVLSLRTQENGEASEIAAGQRGTPANRGLGEQGMAPEKKIQS